jgi:hypothetical protein
MEHSKYTLVVNKKRISVTKEVYKAYYHCRNREKYLDKLANKNNISLENCMEKGIPGRLSLKFSQRIYCLKPLLLTKLIFIFVCKRLSVSRYSENLKIFISKKL